MVTEVVTYMLNVISVTIIVTGILLFLVLLFYLGSIMFDEPYKEQIKEIQEEKIDKLKKKREEIKENLKLGNFGNDELKFNIDKLKKYVKRI